jgi:hypothetical protein
MLRQGVAMPGIDETKEFVPLKIAVLTISDTRDIKDDKSGALLVQPSSLPAITSPSAASSPTKSRQSAGASRPGSPIR